MIGWWNYGIWKVIYWVCSGRGSILIQQRRHSHWNLKPPTEPRWRGFWWMFRLILIRRRSIRRNWRGQKQSPSRKRILSMHSWAVWGVKKFSRTCKKSRHTWIIRIIKYGSDDFINDTYIIMINVSYVTSYASPCYPSFICETFSSSLDPWIRPSFFDRIGYDYFYSHS